MVERRSPKPDAGGSSPSWPAVNTKGNKTLGKIIKFLKEVRSELDKVTWPTKNELVGSTIVTVVVTFIISIFIGFVDRLLTLATRNIFG